MFQSPDRRDVQDREKLKVLIVDDEPTLRLGFAYALTNKSTSVETAADGRQALDRISEVHFDIAILDLRMPEIDGMGVIRTLRESGNRLPIVLCSAALTPYAAFAAIRYGIVDFLLKPVRPVDLRQVIDFVLHPEPASLPFALQAARESRFDVAIGILENQPELSNQARLWLGVLKSIRDDNPPGDPPLFSDEVRASLTKLAYNASPGV